MQQSSHSGSVACKIEYDRSIKIKMNPTLLIVLILNCIVLNVSGQSNIYVSVDGNDQAAGAIGSPLRSLAKAIVLSQNSSSKKINIFLRQGTYYPDTTIVIDSKNSKHKIINISGYKKERVVISGAKKVSVEWKIYKENIYAAKLTLQFEPDAMFINNGLAILARYPNYDSSARVFNGVAADAISDEKVRQWNNPAGGFIHTLHSGEWGSFHYRITGKDNNGKLKIVGGWQNNRPSSMHANFRFVENIFEELDAPGEWYYNSKEQLLYYYPRNIEEIQNGTVELTRLKSLICLQGDQVASQKNISISNLEFTGTKRVLMEGYEPLLRSDWMLHRSGAIFLNGTNNCTISNCSFSQLGATAIMISGYNKNVVVNNNHFKDLGGSGICFVGDTSAVRSPAFNYEQHLSYETIDKTPGPKNNLYPFNCLVFNNLIHDIGRIEKQATGVEISMSQNITVRQNTIYNTPRAGINIGDGSWGGHIIEYNDVFNTVMETGDHGAFNSWGRDRFWDANRNYMDSLTAVHPELILLDAQKTTIIRNNRFRCDHGWDIDLDDGSSNYHIYNNICLNGGIKLREGFYRTVENNIMINNSFHPHVWFKNSGDIFKRNIVTRNYYPIVIPFWGKEVDYNFFPDSISLAKAQKNNTDKNSLFGTPQFVNDAKGDYRIQNGSRALTIGFKNFDVNNFGVTDPRLKAKALSVAIPILIMPSKGSVDKTSTMNWLDAVIKNVNGIGDRSAYGLPSESGVIVLSIKMGSAGVKTGLLEKDVIVEAEGVAVKDIFDLMNQYQHVNWTGKMSLIVMRNQQLVNIVIKLK